MTDENQTEQPETPETSEADETPAAERPCPVCGNEERGQGGYLLCECPARLGLDIGGEMAALRAENTHFRHLLQAKKSRRNVPKVMTNAV